jgi:hypothetical protein
LEILYKPKKQSLWHGTYPYNAYYKQLLHVQNFSVVVDTNHAIKPAVDTSHITKPALDTINHITKPAVDTNHVIKPAVDTHHVIKPVVDANHVIKPVVIPSFYYRLLEAALTRGAMCIVM